MSASSPNSPTRQVLIREETHISRVQEVNDDDPAAADLAAFTLSPSSVEAAPTPAANPHPSSVLMGALMENWIHTKYPGVSAGHRHALFQVMASDLGVTLGGIGFDAAAADDSLAGERSQYIAAVEKYATDKLGKLIPDTANTAATSKGTELVRSSSGSYARQPLNRINYSAPRLQPRRSMSLPIAGTFATSRAVIDTRETSPLRPDGQDSVAQNTSLVKPTRLSEEYFEHEMIGKGGFGEVYKVVHKLDHAIYALKKIRIKASDFTREAHEFQAGANKVLTELRTLARLEHVNIVRYFNSWIEHNGVLVAQPDAPSVSRPAESLSAIAEESQFSDESKLIEGNRLDIIFESTDSDGVSETADSDDASETADSDDASETTDSDDVSKTADSDDASETADSDDASETADSDDASETADSDDASETADSDDSIFAGGSSAAGTLIKRRSSFNEPTITIYITMSLYPLTLTDYLSRKRAGKQHFHCFCPISALTIFGDILNGVEYLHAEGVVHRDLKPGNVFLNVGKPTECCKQTGCGVVPKIGDFGLVAAVEEEHAPLRAASRTRRVGTTFYSAPEGGQNPAVDVWALGIILFEMLYRFDTASERAVLLDRLYKGTLNALPIDPKLAAIVKRCCCLEPRKRVTLTELKDIVANVLAELQQERKKQADGDIIGDGADEAA
ncbi:kinase-like domain-containing protein [Sphaerosporella brunnea]|uniref:Kinase-like domain-containing protein n=1 Tax=Sphaerosporella brunnea TaxID=1250544 RepID=A0A5J5EE04_9PEZI|nr:kinase-like domain-containing protein [Sphaerosporella brunnea]